MVLDRERVQEGREVTQSKLRGLGGDVRQMT